MNHEIDDEPHDLEPSFIEGPAVNLLISLIFAAASGAQFKILSEIMTHPEQYQHINQGRVEVAAFGLGLASILSFGTAMRQVGRNESQEETSNNS